VTLVSVIVGSTREGRFSEKRARWILQHLRTSSPREGRSTAVPISPECLCVRRVCAPN
jgi:NAD(P)H-dependent FMN reductase